jgi:hypothetical protein
MTAENSDLAAAKRLLDIAQRGRVLLPAGDARAPHIIHPRQQYRATTHGRRRYSCHGANSPFKAESRMVVSPSP